MPDSASLTPLSLGLEALYKRTDFTLLLQRDPVRFVHRFPRPEDAELAAVYAAGLAYGRVDLFAVVLERLHRVYMDHGGPQAWVQGLTASSGLAEIGDLQYRWTRGPDLVLMGLTLQSALRRHGSLGALFHAHRHPDLRTLLNGAVGELRELALERAPELGLSAEDFSQLPRGLRYLLVRPKEGSGCKRLNMMLRWMCRPGKEGVDLGFWRSPRAEQLVIPVDTHVLRIAALLGLTSRSDGSWKTAQQITDGLRAIDAGDPIRFDFGIAHLGISGACRAKFHADLCPVCPLRAACSEGQRGL